MTHIEIICDEGIDPLPTTEQAALERLAAAVTNHHALPEVVRLVFIDDAYMAHLNGAYRGKEGTTDVLSFDLGPSPGQPHSGEIYISQPQAQRQASEQDVAPLAETARLLVHGLLHLAGWVHDTPDQLSAMERETETLLDATPL